MLKGNRRKVLGNFRNEGQLNDSRNSEVQAQVQPGRSSNYVETVLRNTALI
jgi:hypothetical protein